MICLQDKRNRDILVGKKGTFVVHVQCLENATWQGELFWKEKEKIRSLYKSANDNETEALKIQMQLRDKINNRLKLEKMNE